jgi:hypothetical protein
VLDAGDEISPPLFEDAPMPPRKDAANGDADDAAVEQDADDADAMDPDI